MSVGQINLSKSTSDKEEACLELLQSSPSNSPTFKLLSNIQFVRALQQQQTTSSRPSRPVASRPTPAIKATASEQVMRPLGNVRVDRSAVGQKARSAVANRLERARLPTPGSSYVVKPDELHGRVVPTWTEAVRVAVPAAGLDGAPGVADWKCLRNKYGW